MKATFQREKLLQAFQIAAAIVPSRTPKPILENVRMELVEDRAILSSTDLEVGLQVIASGADVEQEGETLLPSSKLLAILRELRDETIFLESAGDQVMVRGESAEFNLATADPLDYPPVAVEEREHYHAVGCRAFRDLVRRTIFATDPESVHYALGGIHLEFEPESVVAVATDGRRLASQAVPARLLGNSSAPSALVPPSCLRLVDRALGNVESEVAIWATETTFELWTDSVKVISRLIQGRFPNWRDVVPRDAPAARFEISVDILESAVRQAQIVADREYPGVILSLAPGSLLVMARSREAGESRIRLPLDYDGPEFVVKLNPRYLLDFLGVLDGDSMVTVEGRGPGKAMLFATTDGYTHLVMPMALE